MAMWAQGLYGGKPERPAHRTDHQHSTNFTLGSGMGMVLERAPLLALLFSVIPFFFIAFICYFLASQQLNIHRFYFANTSADGDGILSGALIHYPTSLSPGWQWGQRLVQRRKCTYGHMVRREPVCEFTDDGGSVLGTVSLGIGKSSFSYLFLSLLRLLLDKLNIR